MRTRMLSSIVLRQLNAARSVATKFHLCDGTDRQTDRRIDLDNRALLTELRHNQKVSLKGQDSSEMAF